MAKKTRDSPVQTKRLSNGTPWTLLFLHPGDVTRVIEKQVCRDVGVFLLDLAAEAHRVALVYPYHNYDHVIVPRLKAGKASSSPDTPVMRGIVVRLIW
jgi:hypothetical protein